ncbi:molybdopterin-dependent oxidoreductase, partial [Thermodesulfobacteriota bacterium]
MTEKVIRTVCGIEDGVNCGILAHVRDGKLVKVEPADFPDPRLRHICARGLSSIELAYHPDRLKYPLKRVGERGEGKWERISWDEALDTIADRLKEIGEKYGFKSLAWVTGQPITFVLMRIYQRIASALQSTWVSILGFGDSAGPCGDVLSYGHPAGDFYSVNFESPELCVIWGGNMAETRPIYWRKIRDEKEKGAKLVVIDPRFTSSASKADKYIAIRPGTDTALILGMLKWILDKGLEDRPFITEHTVGPLLVRSDNGRFMREKDVFPGESEKYLVWDSQTGGPLPYDETGTAPALSGVYQVAGIECSPALQCLKDLTDQYPLETTAEITQVPSETIEKLAEDYATCKPVASYRGQGLQRTFYGDVAYRAITTLAAVTGNIKPEGYRRFMLRPSSFIKATGKPYKPLPLMQLYDTITSEKPYPIKALWIAAHNFVNQNPDSNRVINELFPKLDFIVVAEMFMNTTARYADIVLPVCSFFERLDLVPSSDPINPYMQLQQKVIEPLHESKSDLAIVSELAQKMGHGEHFRESPEEYLETLLSSKHPSMAGITLESLKEGPAPLKSYEVPAFPTASGRIEFYSEAMLPFDQELP